MKHGRRPTRKQKELLQKYRLDMDNWLQVLPLRFRTLLAQRYACLGITGKTRTLRRGYKT